MRFLFEYKNLSTKETINPTVDVLETFLNEHLIRSFHGNAFECIYLHFITNLPSTKKGLRLRLLYGSMAEMEMVHSFINEKKLNLSDFHSLLDKVQESILKASEIPYKEGMFYDRDTLLADYKRCKTNAPSTQEELEFYAANLKETNKRNYAKRIDCILEQDKQNPRPLTKRLEEFVVHDPFDIFYPLSFRYSEVLSSFLRSAGIYLPGYRQIHLHLGVNMIEAKQELALEEWYKYTYFVIDIPRYQQSSDKQKEEMLLQSISDGLRYIADFDHLDKEKIEDVLLQVQKEGLEAELLYLRKENQRYHAEVVYHVPQLHTDKATFTLRVTDLETKQQATAIIGEFDLFSVGAILSKLHIQKEKIVIKGRTGTVASYTRKSNQALDAYTFLFSELFYKNSEFVVE